MNREQQEELAALHALGALDGDDLVAWQNALAGEVPEALAAQARQRDIAALLAAAARPPAAPPPALREKVLACVRRTPQAPAPRAIGAARKAEGGFRFIPKDEGEWQPMAGIPGARCKRLAVNPASNYVVLLMQLDPGTRFPEHPHHGHEEIYLVSGDAQTEGRRLGPGDFFHADPGTLHGSLYSEHGCTALLVTPLPVAASPAPTRTGRARGSS